MKPLPPSRTTHRQYDSVRLYRDDLERICGLLRDAGFEVTISDSSFSYESLEELRTAAGNSPGALEITATHSPDSSSSVSKSGRFWYVSGYGPEHLALVREIETVLLNRQSKVEHLPLHWIMQGGLFIAFVGVVLMLLGRAAGRVLAWGGCTVLIGALGLVAYWQQYPKAVLNYRHEAGFVRRNKDALMLLAAGAVIGALAQFLASRLLPRVAP